ncbi:MAG: rhodanese-like domain-containing protein [Victivallales bacterium]|jgi:phage shock protein E|nr:rhodanese-like domain-containing protein [Victivallales bacterium]
MRRLLFALSLLLGGAACSRLADDPTKTEEPPALIIDVRSEQEYAQGHLPGAILIPYDQIGERIGKYAPDRATKIGLYCRSGRRAGSAKATLEKMNYSAVENLGGMEDAAKKLNFDHN